MLSCRAAAVVLVFVTASITPFALSAQEAPEAPTPAAAEEVPADEAAVIEAELMYAAQNGGAAS
ncbi:MAG: hypothetical protein AAGF45_05860, partial [Pseudomonadota bacterium]